MFNLPLGWNDPPFPHWLLLPTEIWSLHQLTLPEVAPAWPEFSLGLCPVVHTSFLIPCMAQKFTIISSATGYLHMSLIPSHKSGATLLNPSHWNQVHTPWLYFSAICSVTAFSYRRNFSTNLTTGLPWDRVSITMILIQFFFYMVCLLELLSLNLQVITTFHLSFNVDTIK